MDPWTTQRSFVDRHRGYQDLNPIYTTKRMNGPFPRSIHPTCCSIQAPDLLDLNHKPRNSRSEWDNLIIKRAYSNHSNSRPQSTQTQRQSYTHAPVSFRHTKWRKTELARQPVLPHISLSFRILPHGANDPHERPQTKWFNAQVKVLIPGPCGKLTYLLPLPPHHFVLMIVWYRIIALQRWVIHINRSWIKDYGFFFIIILFLLRGLWNMD